MTDDVEAEEFVRQVAREEMNGVLMGSQNFPEPPDKDSLLRFMRNVVDERDDKKTVKTANFREEEVGRTKVPVLTYLQLAGYADTEGYGAVKQYLMQKAGNVAAVSLGRKAKLLEVLFTTRREMRNLGTPKVTTKQGFFGSTEIKEGMES